MPDGMDRDFRRRTLARVDFAQAAPNLDPDYSVKGLIGEKQIIAIFGPPGCGKTFFALALGVHIAAGREFFGLRTRRGGVAYLGLEGEAGLRNRLAAARAGYDLPGDLSFLGLAGSMNLIADPGSLPEAIAAILDFEEETGPPVKVVFVDTVGQAIAGEDENSSQGMGRIVAAAARIRHETGASVVLLHHSGKDASRGMRGHSVLLGAVDAAISVERDEQSKIATAKPTKMRDAADDWTINFRLASIPLGVDADGDTISSCIVEDSDPPEPPRLEKRVPRASQTFMTALGNALLKLGRPLPAGPEFPHRLGCVIEDVRPFFAELIGSDVTAESRRQQFLRGRKSALDAGIIAVKHDWIWAVTETRDRDA